VSGARRHIVEQVPCTPWKGQTPAAAERRDAAAGAVARSTPPRAEALVRPDDGECDGGTAVPVPGMSVTNFAGSRIQSVGHQGTGSRELLTECMPVQTPQ
jgi:hypothetical protein